MSDRIFAIYCLNIELDKDIPLLLIPSDVPSRFSTRPFKWILYAVSAVLGTTGGQLFNRGETNELVDLEDAQPTPCELSFLPASLSCLVDVGVLQNCVSSTEGDSVPSHFRDQVVTRDNGTCVITGYRLQSCDACHLIPRKKGDEYIERVSNMRATGLDVIRSINSIRNGVLFTASIHRIYNSQHGKGMAILPTPNFALRVDEVLPQPNQQNPLKRYTPHYFDGADDESWTHDLRYPPADNEWPPNFLLDYIYGVLILRNYGNNAAGVEGLVQDTQSAYYDEGSAASDEDSTASEKSGVGKSQRGQQDSAAIEQGQLKESSHRRTELEDSYDRAMDRVYRLWAHSTYGPLGQEARKRAKEERKKREAEERVKQATSINTWREKITADGLEHIMQT